MKNPHMEWLEGVLAHMFRDEPKDMEEYKFLHSVAYELEQCAVADGWLTWEEINYVHNLLEV